MMYSATELAFEPGADAKAMPRFLRYSKSMWSVPMVAVAWPLTPMPPEELHSPYTPYINTIPAHLEERSPGDVTLEERIRSYCRWNAMVMVARANRNDDELGGHIAAVVSVSGRVDLAAASLPAVTAPTLLIVSRRERVVLDADTQHAVVETERSRRRRPGPTTTRR